MSEPPDTIYAAIMPCPLTGEPEWMATCYGPWKREHPQAEYRRDDKADPLVRLSEVEAAVRAAGYVVPPQSQDEFVADVLARLAKPDAPATDSADRVAELSKRLHGIRTPVAGVAGFPDPENSRTRNDATEANIITDHDAGDEHA